MVNTSAVAALIVVASVAAGLIYVASMGGFNPSERTINDPIESGDTKAVENPAPPDHPAFSSAEESNRSSILAFNSTASGAR